MFHNPKRIAKTRISTWIPTIECMRKIHWKLPSMCWSSLACVVKFQHMPLNYINARGKISSWTVFIYCNHWIRRRVNCLKMQLIMIFCLKISLRAMDKEAHQGHKSRGRGKNSRRGGGVRRTVERWHRGEDREFHPRFPSQPGKQNKSFSFAKTGLWYHILTLEYDNNSKQKAPSWKKRSYNQCSESIPKSRLLGCKKIIFSYLLTFIKWSLKALKL